jgi:hypothetical protein
MEIETLRTVEKIVDLGDLDGLILHILVFISANIFQIFILGQYIDMIELCILIVINVCANTKLFRKNPRQVLRFVFTLEMAWKLMQDV